MSNELQHFIQITDKWSKRRFAMRLGSSRDFSSIGEVINYLRSLLDSDIDELVKNGRISEAGTKGLEDIRSIMFHIENNGQLGSIIEEIKLKQRGKTLIKNDSLKFEHRKTSKEGYVDIYVAELILDRDDVPFTRNRTGFYKRRWSQNPKFQEFVESIITAKFPDRSEKILAMDSENDTLDFLRAVAGTLFSAAYELYSRFTGRNLRYKTGPETLECIMSGKGGNCSEKATAFEFIAANYGISGKLVLGGDRACNTFPYAALRRALDDFDFRFKDEAQQYWSHFANLFETENTRVLIDATGGPIPYLYCTGQELDEYLSQHKSVPLWFLANKEDYFYHDTPQDIAGDLLYSLEAFMPDSDLYHVLGPDDEDSPFGLIITKELWVCPVVYKAESEFSQYRKEWEDWGRSTERVARLEVYPNMDASPNKEILTRLEEKIPVLVADLRTAEDNFIERCRQEWKDKSWQSGYVFVEFRNLDGSI